ncbi:arrestin domain-containing protein 3 isoform X3 [Astyanax mexicanus]|uniref:arrestin domain-containing protein 3 isoform X3 n=1 Tax=Astyanax mexicanus TaxID=7994 RepID=UPI0020CB2344|nr:arrestin domain-containing protein 3 isoform X3 [Astyanax mexicanus]
MKLTIEYNAINERNTFSSGDTLTGQVIVEVSKKTTVKSLTIKAKGKANVLWSESDGEHSVTYWDSDKYFSQTEAIVPKDHDDGSFTLSPGINTFHFVIQLPPNDLPSSFKGKSGKVKYHLLAQLRRTLRAQSKAETEFTFISRRPDSLLPLARTPQHGAKDKDVGFFSSGNISMNIYLEKTGYQQGENLVIRGEIVNSSTKNIVPTYIIYQKQSFFASGKRSLHISHIVQEKEAALPSSSRLTVSKILTIPSGVTPTILNCRILKVEYRLKVILDVSFTKNPELKLPLVILPACDGAMAKVLETDEQL